MKMFRIQKNKKGFTLVEIMIVVAIIGLLVAIAIPNLLRARVSANEAAAKASIRTMITALENYRADQNPPTYPTALSTLSGSTPPYLDAVLAGGTKQGYTFAYYTATAVSITILATTYSVVPAYSIHAGPITAGTTGNAFYYANSTGVIYSGTATAGAAYAATAPSGFVPVGN